MDLKAKVQEGKEYNEVKKELTQLIDKLSFKYEEYEKIYKDKYDQWVNKIISDFTIIFESEGFQISTTEKNYSFQDQYKIIKAIINDLEFELSIDINSYYSVRFLQNKPKSEYKNIVIKPTIECYDINKEGIRRIINEINATGYSLSEINQQKVDINEKLDLLLENLEKIENEELQGIATPMNEFGILKKEFSYGEFDNLSELIERI